ncbi:MAG: 50S ribosomal protein L25, partial [Rhabdochlamydiaceae bacterium]
VKDIQYDPLSGAVIHVDFFQPNLKEKVEVAVPLVFEGVAPAEKDLGGTLNKNIQEIEVRALPQDLPHEIVVDIGSLKTFEDHILVKNLSLPANVEALNEPEEIVASVLEPHDIEADLAQEITEDVSKVGVVEKEKPEEEAPAEETSAQEQK